jgi:hypothetical protein
MGVVCRSRWVSRRPRFGCREATAGLHRTPASRLEKCFSRSEEMGGCETLRFFSFESRGARCPGLHPGYVSSACALGSPRRGVRQIPDEATSSEVGSTHFGAASTDVTEVSVQIAAALSWVAIGCAQSVAFLVYDAANYTCFAVDCSKSAATCSRLHSTASGTPRTDDSPPVV